MADGGPTVGCEGLVEGEVGGPGKAVTFEIDYLALAPELVVVATMLGVFALDLVLPRSKKFWTATLAVAGIALAAVPLVILAADGTVRSMFDGTRLETVGYGEECRGGAGIVTSVVRRPAPKKWS